MNPLCRNKIVPDCPNDPECKVTNSTHYFMCHMTKQDWSDRRAWTSPQREGEFEYHFTQIQNNTVVGGRYILDPNAVEQ